MRILIILALVGFGIFAAVGYLGDRWKDRATPNYAHNKPDLQESSDPDGASESSNKPTLKESEIVKLPNAPIRATQSSVFFVHRFVNRPAPKIPPFVQDKKNLSISLDEPSNSWIVEASEDEAPHIHRIIKLIDTAPDELDLDFVLLAVSEKWIRSIGVNLTFADGANYLSSVGIYDTAGGLRFSSGSVAVDISAEKSNENISVYRTPVIRVLEGESWKISETIETPIPVTQTIDGVSTTTIQYTSLGLILNGRLTRGTKGWRLDLNQVNGSQGATVEINGFSVPEQRTQELQTSVYLEQDKWTVCGGVRNIEKTTSKGIFNKKVGESKDLILIFCRPRTSLRKIYKAIPPTYPKVTIPTENNTSLLPPKK